MPPEPINVAASIIADISAGIYRSPAGALKELISNAFDADALSVRVSTGWPSFKTFTCTDDGLGMKPDEFRRIMGHIGGSTKRDSAQVSSQFSRPLIGRIGIGLLSIAQVCRRFTVISSAAGDDRKFRAEIDLEPYLLAEARRTALGQTLDTESGRVRIGTYDIEEAPEERGTHYTRIVMEEIDPGFQQRLKDIPQKRGGFSPKTFSKGTMRDFLATVEKGSTVAEHGAYAQMVWELAVTAPVEYMDGGPIRATKDLAPLRVRYDNYSFKAFLDGVQLQKPIRLPRDSSIEHRVYPIHYGTTLSDKRKLALVGYLYWQQGRIIPRELQGVLVRVRNVAIGQYDPTYMGYPHHEGWKFSQMTGEIYVDEGLDQAVNIDRSSFRESDEAFIALQGFLFERLKGGTDEGAGIFTDIKKETGKIREQVKEQEEKKRQRVVARLTTGHDRPLRLETVDSDATSSGVVLGRGSIKLDASLLDRVPHRHRELFVAVCSILERGIRSSVVNEKRRAIYEKVAELLSQF